MPGVTLPKNLTLALQGLGDADLGTLHREVAAEIERRRGRTKANAAASAEIPAGKANLIRASHQAGMKPAAIARTLRVSATMVNRVLGTPGKSRA